MHFQSLTQMELLPLVQNHWCNLSPPSFWWKAQHRESSAYIFLNLWVKSFPYPSHSSSPATTSTTSTGSTSTSSPFNPSTGSMNTSSQPSSLSTSSNTFSTSLLSSSSSIMSQPPPNTSMQPSTRTRKNPVVRAFVLHSQ
jgi:hypothetical protein